MRVGYLVCGDEIMDSLYANAVSVLGATNTACQKALIDVYKRQASECPAENNRIL